MRHTSRPPTGRLTTRVFAAMGLVVVAGAGTLLLVALSIAPMVYHQHLLRAGVDPNGLVGHHAEAGFRAALTAAVVSGAVAAVLVAALIAWLGSRRLVEPIRQAALVADQLAAGDYSVRLRATGTGVELDQLTTAINTLAERLESAETIRIRLFADLTHELRTPLTSILATVEAIHEGIMPADERTLAVLDEQARRLGRLIDDLGRVSRAEEHAFRVAVRQVELRPITEAAVVGATARYAAAQVSLSVVPGPAVIAVADPDRIAEVLDQLLDNAIRQCSPGDSVVIEVAHRGDRAALVVRDTGHGFAPAEAELLFARFHRGAAPGTGSGIGLTIARALVIAQRGTLTGASDGPGTGAAFTIELPTA